MAMHVEQMSLGLCPANICPAPGEGDVEAAAAASRWRPVLVVIVTTCMLQWRAQIPCVPGPRSRGAIACAVGRWHNEAVSDCGGVGDAIDLLASAGCT